VSVLSPIERVGGGAWLPPWVRFQHQQRYHWAAQQARGLAVLDAACGSGYGTRALAAAGASSVVGLDLSDATIRACRAEGTDAQLRFEAGDVTRLPLPDASVDLYVSFETVEHVEDDDRFVAEARRVLRPSGRLVCSTPNRAVTNPGTAITDPPFNPYHLREYTPDELRTLLGRHFGTVELLGQSAFRGGYLGGLRALSRVSPRAAVRAHQMAKLLGVPFDSPDRHAPRPVRPGREPEILVAVCR
jgi:SAM-dependent methyltransferase